MIIGALVGLLLIWLALAVVVGLIVFISKFFPKKEKTLQEWLDEKRNDED